MKQDENNQPSFKENVSDDNNTQKMKILYIHRGMEYMKRNQSTNKLKRIMLILFMVKGIIRNKILIAMMFGMFIAILNQTLLNVVNTCY